MKRLSAEKIEVLVNEKIAEINHYYGLKLERHLYFKPIYKKGFISFNIDKDSELNVLHTNQIERFERQLIKMNQAEKLEFSGAQTVHLVFKAE